VSPSQYLGPAGKASGFGPSSPILGPTLRSRDVRRAPLPVVWPSQCAAGLPRATCDRPVGRRRCPTAGYSIMPRGKCNFLFCKRDIPSQTARTDPDATVVGHTADGTRTGGRSSLRTSARSSAFIPIPPLSHLFYRICAYVIAGMVPLEYAGIEHRGVRTNRLPRCRTT
jgi:hypothetical protein